jgi:hypothetical protein
VFCAISDYKAVSIDGDPRIVTLNYLAAAKYYLPPNADAMESSERVVYVLVLHPLSSAMILAGLNLINPYLCDAYRTLVWLFLWRVLLNLSFVDSSCLNTDRRMNTCVPLPFIEEAE